jgi:uncharacterized protein involved in exopolysaccharide biosynthesis
MKRDAWKRLARFLARLYPLAWRKRYGAELDALLEDAPPKPRDAFDILWGAFRMQITTWSFARITLACTLIGVLASVAISFAWPNRYLSEAKIKMTPEQVPESGGPAAINQVMWDRVASIHQEILSRYVLTTIIQRYNLYPSERTHSPMNDVVESMRKHLVVQPVVPASPGRVIPAFAIQFSYPDAHVAQQVTTEVMSRFIDANVTRNTNDELRANPGHLVGSLNSDSGMRLEPLDTASLPVTPAGPNRAAIAGLGLFAGLLAGLTLALVIRSRRRTAVCPTCGQRVAAPIRSEPRL